ncbi:MAG TPA: molybdenum cofactor guanylyltransferase [Syntrophomonadaceae bacterium]|nr:molybdenum cofactor guanylyltransferase [Syntrophomonadaceae bacterium]
MKISGAILAGGKSSRMKYNKAFAELGDMRIIDIILARFKQMFDETIIITNDPEEYQDLGVEVYTDIYPRLGPIGGIHSALVNSTNEVVFALACDMPFVPDTLIKYMFDRIDGYDTVVARTNGFFQATAALYNKSSLPVLTDCLENKKLKTTLLFRDLNSKVLEENELIKFGDLDDIFFNINDKSALLRAQELSRRFFP